MPASVTRRRVLLLAVLCLGAGIAWFLWRALRVEPDSLIVAEYVIPVPGWPAAADGFRIAAVGDVHAGAPFIDEAKLAVLTARINAARPDLVIWLGDYVIQGVLGGTFMEPETVTRLLAPARGRVGTFAIIGNHDRWLDSVRVGQAFEAAGIPFLRWQSGTFMEPETVTRLLAPARGRVGTFAIIGNHDRWLDSVRVGQAFEAAGISFLRWESATFSAGGKTAHLYGLDDFELSPGFWPRFRAVHEEWESLPPDEPLIALSHNPDVFVYMPTRVNLTLASHTHGGQVRLPLIGSPIVPSSLGQRYARGLVVEKGRPMFVNTGIGTSIIPIRFGVPPEISILTLRSTTAGR